MAAGKVAGNDGVGKCRLSTEFGAPVVHIVNGARLFEGMAPEEFAFSHHLLAFPQTIISTGEGDTI